MADTEANISDLAAEGSKRERKASLPPIPLTFLAPLLVALAIVGTLLPNTFILTSASDDSVGFLAEQYLSSILAKTKLSVENPVKNLEPVVSYLVNEPNIITAFQNQSWSDFKYSPMVPPIVAVARHFAVDSVACTTARWRPGFGVGDAINPNTTYYVMVYSVPIGGGNAIVGILDRGEPLYQHIFLANTTTNYPIYATDGGSSRIDDDLPEGAKFGLGINPSEVTTIFGIFYSRDNVGFLTMPAFEGNDPIAKFACAAGLRVDTRWVALLKAAKPSNGTVVALMNYDPNVEGQFTLMAGSNQIINSAATVAADRAKTDDLTLALQRLLRERYKTVSAAITASENDPLFVAKLLGTTYIINLGQASFAPDSAKNAFDGRYDNLLVIAMPRAEVYGKIEAARKRSRGVSAGIGTALTVVVAAVFVLVVLPLRTLARQMQQLTKLDFGTLESSGALERRSLIAELRAVQVVFATMTRAFAGAIKRNKNLVSSVAQRSQNQSQTQSSVATPLISNR